MIENKNSSTSPPLSPYPQNVECIGFSEANAPEPTGFRDNFHRVSEGIYPGDAVEHMERDAYDPVIIGYTHASESEKEFIENKLTNLLEQTAAPLKVLLEIDPQQLQWIKDFVELEREFKATGMVSGTKPRADEADRMESYKWQLRRKHGEGLALWCLEAGMDVQTIEHPDVQNWIHSDNYDYDPLEHEGDGRDHRVRVPREFKTAIKRDSYGLTKIDEERPDVILVGYLHALKYDALMNRDGRSTFYYLSQPIEWRSIEVYWKAAHELHKEKAAKYGRSMIENV